MVNSWVFNDNWIILDFENGKKFHVVRRLKSNEKLLCWCRRKSQCCTYSHELFVQNDGRYDAFIQRKDSHEKKKPKPSTLPTTLNKLSDKGLPTTKTKKNKTKMKKRENGSGEMDQLQFLSWTGSICGVHEDVIVNILSEPLPTSYLPTCLYEPLPLPWLRCNISNEY